VFTAEDYSHADFFGTPSAAAAAPLLAMSVVPAASPLMQLAAMASSSCVHDGAASPLDSALLHLAGAALQYLEAELSQASTFGAPTAAPAAVDVDSCLPSLSGSEYVGSIDDGAWGGEEEEQQHGPTAGTHWGYDDDGRPVCETQQQAVSAAVTAAAAEAEPASPQLQQRCSFFNSSDEEVEVSAQAAGAEVEGGGRTSPALFATPTATPVGVPRTRQASSGVAALLLSHAGDTAEPREPQERQQQYTAVETQWSLLPDDDNTGEGSAAAHGSVEDAAAAFMSFDGSSRTAAAWARATPAPMAEGSSRMLPSMLQRWLSRTTEESDEETDSTSSSTSSMDAAEVQQGPGLHAGIAEVHAAADADVAAAAPTNASWSSPSASTSSSIAEVEQQLQQQQQQQQQEEEEMIISVHAGEALPTCSSVQHPYGSLSTAADGGSAAGGEGGQPKPAAAVALAAAAAAAGDAAAEHWHESQPTGVLAAASEAEHRLGHGVLLEEAQLSTNSVPSADTAAVAAAESAAQSQCTQAAAAGGLEGATQQPVVLKAAPTCEQATAQAAAALYSSIRTIGKQLCKLLGPGCNLPFLTLCCC
jgi:hypothetical protein